MDGMTVSQMAEDVSMQRQLASETRFRFGDVIENGWASDDNPTKRAYFVRDGLRPGRLNPGRYAILTDGCGNFWEAGMNKDHKLVKVSDSQCPKL